LLQVESALNFCDYVDNVCVYGNSFHTSVIALIVPNRKALTALAADMNKGSLTFAEICQDEDVIAAVRTALADHGLKSGLQRVELPSQIKLCSEEWLPDNGLVTASFKVRRRQIEDFYKQDIIRMYTSPSSSKST
jgi:long-chain acyl-CoA synthetase